jgi:hypothetical protein
MQLEMNTIRPLSDELVVLARFSSPEIVSRLSTSALTFAAWPERFAARSAIS